MATGCLTDLIAGLDSGCAVSKRGGNSKRVFIGQVSHLDETAPYTVDADGNISSLNFAINGSVPYTLHKFIGKKDTNNWSMPLVAGDNVNTFNQTGVIALYYDTSEDLARIENLANADDLFMIYEGNDSRLIVLGLYNPDGQLIGLNCSAGDGGSGNVMNDSTAYTMTFNGEMMATPRYFKTATNSTLAADILYLNGISS